jgi:hypothetical protein
VVDGMRCAACSAAGVEVVNRNRKGRQFQEGGFKRTSQRDVGFRNLAVR